MRFKLLIILLTIISACKQESNIDNPNGIWTDSEISELKSIIYEFDQILTSEYKTNSEEAYTLFSKIIIEEGGIPDLNGFKRISTEIKNSEVFDKIWIISEGSLVLKYNSHYQKYLKELGKKSNLINFYSERFESSGGIQPSMTASLLQNIKKLDLKDKNHKLIFAVHFLTLFNQ